MKNLVVYRVISYILLFVAAFLSVGVLTSLLAALANPAALLPIFVMACVIIYTYCSWLFLVRGIDKGMVNKPLLRDLIKLNGYITFVLALILIFTALVAISNPDLLKQATQQLKDAQPAGTDITEEKLARQVYIMMRAMLGYSILLVVHTIITFRLLKRYPHAFADRSN